MKIDATRFAGPCGCGKTHTLETQVFLVEPGATARLPQVADELKLPPGGVVVCDSNTRPYADQAAAVLAGRLHSGAPIVQLPAQGLHADEKAVALLNEQLPADAGWLLAVGSGTIHDATRYVANERKVGFVSYPTAATVDGFVSTVSAMTWYGFKKTLPGVAPLAVVADTNVFAAAPPRLTAAGVGDVLGKYTSLADWEISHIVTGEEYCEDIVALTRQAVDTVLENLAGIHAGEAGPMEQLMYALLLSGIGMQMWGNSRPASGAEHHLSHLWEMEVLNEHIDALHGEKVGVGVNLLLPIYRHVGKLDALPPALPYEGLPLDDLWRFGDLRDDVIEENTPDLLEAVDPALAAERFPAVKAALAKLPQPQELEQAMRGAGCHTRMEEIGLDESLRADSLCFSPFVRRRMTLMRLMKRFDFAAAP